MVRHRTPEISPSRADKRNLHAPGRDEAAAVIADAPHPRAECALYSKRDAGVVREHDDMLQRRALERRGGRKRRVSL